MSVLAPLARLRSIALLACTVVIASCGPSTAPLTIELRTSDTHAAIVGAGVEIDSLALGPSLQVSDVVDDLMGRRVSFTDRAITDTAGRATIAHIPDRAVRITVVDPSRGVPFLLLPSIDDTACWRPMSAPTAEARSAVEVRVVPNSPPASSERQ